MRRKIINILIPSLLLLLALAWTVFGSNILNDGYGFKRDKVITTPAIASTVEGISSIEDLKGYTTYLTFGFSHCAGNCPFTLSQFIKLKSVLPEDTRLIFVSVDNECDNIEHLKDYLANIYPNIIGWRIDNEALQPFAEEFDTHIRVKAGYEPEHGSAIQLIDKNGRWVKTYPYLNLNEKAVMKDYLDLQEMTQTL